MVNGAMLGAAVMIQRQVWVAQICYPEHIRKSIVNAPLMWGTIFWPVVNNLFRQKAKDTERVIRSVCHPSSEEPPSSSFLTCIIGSKESATWGG